MPQILADFTRNCARQGVELDPMVGQMGRPADSLLWSIRVIGQQLAGDPQATFTEEIIPADDFPSDVPTRTFIDIINASYQRVTDMPPARSFENAGKPTLPVCLDADRGFAHTVTSNFLKRRLALPRPFGGDLYVDEATPIFLRKTNHVPSALSMVDVVIDGIPYPAGSIVKLNTADPQHRSERNSRQPIKVHAIDSVTHVTFHRLSAFALPIDQRLDYFPRPSYRMPPLARWLLMHAEIDDIAKYATRFVERHREAA